MRLMMSRQSTRIVGLGGKQNSGVNEKFNPSALATLTIWLAMAFSALGEGSVSPAKCKPTALPVASLIHTDPESPPILTS